MSAAQGDGPGPLSHTIADFFSHHHKIHINTLKTTSLRNSQLIFQNPTHSHRLHLKILHAFCSLSRCFATVSAFTFFYSGVLIHKPGLFFLCNLRSTCSETDVTEMSLYDFHLSLGLSYFGTLDVTRMSRVQCTHQLVLLFESLDYLHYSFYCRYRRERRHIRRL